MTRQEHTVKCYHQLIKTFETAEMLVHYLKSLKIFTLLFWNELNSKLKFKETPFFTGNLNVLAKKYCNKNVENS